MASVALAVGKFGLEGYKAYQSYKGGKEAKSEYDKMAREELYQAGQIEQIALEEEFVLSEQEQEEISGLRGAYAASGLRLQGSIGTATQRVHSLVNRQRRMRSLRTSLQMRGHHLRAGQYSRAGREEYRKGKFGMYGSLLTGGLGFAKTAYIEGWFGKSGSSSLGSTGGMSGLSGQGYWMGGKGK